MEQVNALKESRFIIIFKYYFAASFAMSTYVLDILALDVGIL